MLGYGNGLVCKSLARLCICHYASSSTFLPRSIHGARSLCTLEQQWQSLSIRNPTWTLIPTAGLKRIVGVHRRCRDCNITRVDNRLAVVCKTHPRHNQIQQGVGSAKRIHKVYPWRWPDPFDKKYGYHKYNEDRYLAAFNS